MMDVTFVLEESGVTATVEVPCEADVAAAKEVACTALAVSPASVEMRIGTQVLEGTCRLQDTAFEAGVQVVLARRFADIKCPAEYSLEVPPGGQLNNVIRLTLSPCGALCLVTQKQGYITGLDTETFSPAFKFKVDFDVCGVPAIPRCKTRCYLVCKEGLSEIALPGGKVVRKVDGTSYAVYARGGVVVSWGEQGSLSVYDEDLTLLRSLSHKGCNYVAVSDCGGWVMTSSNRGEDARLWDVNTGEAVACVPADGNHVALSRSASVFAAVCSNEVQLYDWSGAALGSFDKPGYLFVCSMQFTLCGKYLLLELTYGQKYLLQQYDVATMSCVREFSDFAVFSLKISPCSRVILFANLECDTIETRHLYPY